MTMQRCPKRSRLPGYGALRQDRWICSCLC